MAKQKFIERLDETTEAVLLDMASGMANQSTWIWLTLEPSAYLRAWRWCRWWWYWRERQRLAEAV